MKKRHRPRRDLRALAGLDAKREPFADLVAEIVAGALTRYLDASGPVVEIGSGTGALRRWLPADLRARALHTEPAAEPARRFHHEEPGAPILRARAEALPLAAASAAGVVALDVLDELPAPEAVRDELARVLRPGGRLVHLLDLSPDLDAVFAALDDAGEMPLPNFLGDAVAAGALPASEAPPLRPHDDLIAVPRHQLAHIVAALRAARHPLAQPLAAYLAPFFPDVFTPAAARQHYVALRSDPRTAAGVDAALLALYTTARKPQYRAEMPLDLRPLATCEHLGARLRALHAAGWTVEHEGLVTLRRSRPRTDAREPAFRGRWAGHTVTRHAPGTDEVTVEAGVHLFVARRV